MKYLNLFLVTVVAFCGNAMAESPATSNVNVRDAARLNIDNAVEDARHAVAMNDIRLFAVYGITIELPGVTNDSPETRAKYGYRIIEGTGDALKTAEDRKLNDNARAYAARYNKEILIEVAKRP